MYTLFAALYLLRGGCGAPSRSGYYHHLHPRRTITLTPTENICRFCTRQATRLVLGAPDPDTHAATAPRLQVTPQSPVRIGERNSPLGEATGARRAARRRHLCQHLYPLMYHHVCVRISLSRYKPITTSQNIDVPVVYLPDLFHEPGPRVAPTRRSSAAFERFLTLPVPDLTCQGLGLGATATIKDPSTMRLATLRTTRSCHNRRP